MKKGKCTICGEPLYNPEAYGYHTHCAPEPDNRQKLFNYFYEQHNIMLIDDDFNAIRWILGIEI